MSWLSRFTDPSGYVTPAGYRELAARWRREGNQERARAAEEGAQREERRRARRATPSRRAAAPAVSPEAAEFAAALRAQDQVLAQARQVGADPSTAWRVAERLGVARALELLAEHGPGLGFALLAVDFWPRRKAAEDSLRAAQAEELARGRAGAAGEPPAPRRTLLSDFGR